MRRLDRDTWIRAAAMCGAGMCGEHVWGKHVDSKHECISGASMCHRAAHGQQACNALSLLRFTCIPSHIGILQDIGTAAEVELLDVVAVRTPVVTVAYLRRHCTFGDHIVRHAVDCGFASYGTAVHQTHGHDSADAGGMTRSISGQWILEFGDTAVHS